MGPANATVARVEPMRTPVENAGSPSAIAVVATEAISQGASPATITPSRSEPAATNRDASHDKAGSTKIPTVTAANNGLHIRPSRRRAVGSIVSAVAKTKTASRTSIPWCVSNQARGDWRLRPKIEATSTQINSG